MDHLAPGVDAGVGAARHGDAHRPPQQQRQGFFQDALDGRFPGCMAHPLKGPPS